MPANYNYGKQNDTNIIETFHDVIETIRNSPDKKNTINILANKKIHGTNVNIGHQYASTIYDKYIQYNGHSRGRY